MATMKSHTINRDLLFNLRRLQKKFLNGSESILWLGELPSKIRRFRWFASSGSAGSAGGLPDTAESAEKNVPFDQNA